MKRLLIGLSVILVLFISGCGGGGGGSDSSVEDSNIGWVEIKYSSIVNDNSGNVYAYISGTAFTNSSYVAHKCSELCCVLCLYDDSYPGVDVVWENQTNGTRGSAISRYGTLTDWEHIWSAQVPLALGSNKILISASDPAGNYASATTTVDYLPPAPTILSTDTGDSKITLEWSNVSDADSYNIYWSTDPNFTKNTATLAANVTTNIYTHTGLVNGQTYYYAITTIFNGDIESILSEKVSAIAGTPEYPKDVTATASEANIIVSWSESPTATSYNLYWSNEENVTIKTGNLIANVNTPYTHTGLTGIPYHYVVTALNSYGMSNESEEATAMPELPPPAPENLTANMRTVTDSSGYIYKVVDLNWDSVDNITQYILERCTGYGSYLPDPQSCFAVGTEQIYTGTNNYFTDTDTTYGYGYLYRVKTENNFGISSPSEVFGIIVE